MTIDACGLQWFILDDAFILDGRFFVALLAFHILMFPCQSELRLSVMIEQ